MSRLAPGDTQSDKAPSGRLEILDGLRGIAILLVMWYHAWLVSGQRLGPLNFIAEAGYLGVDLFFFISGFCLYYPYALAREHGAPSPSVRRFFKRRAMKIVPSYFLALAVFTLVYRGQFNSPLDALWQLLAHAIFIHPLAPDTFGAISGPLWTIGIEVEFYVLFPMLVVAFRRAPMLGYVVLVALAEGYRTAIAALGWSTSFWCINQLPAVLDLFAAGMLAAHLFVAVRERRRSVDRERATVISIAATLSALVALGIISVATTSQSDVAHDWLNAHRILVGPLCFVIASSTLFAVEPWQALLTRRTLIFLSTISYNLYLWHLEIIVWVHNAGLDRAWTFGLSLAASVGVAALLTRFVERPLLHADPVSLTRSVFRRLARLLRARTPEARSSPSLRSMHETTALSRHPRRSRRVGSRYRRRCADESIQARCSGSALRRGDAGGSRQALRQHCQRGARRLRALYECRRHRCDQLRQ